MGERRRSTQRAPHCDFCDGQAQPPAAHVKPCVQTMPQKPQFDESDCTSTHAPPQVCKGAAQPSPAEESGGTSSVEASASPDAPASVGDTYKGLAREQSIASKSKRGMEQGPGVSLICLMVHRWLTMGAFTSSIMTVSLSYSQTLDKADALLRSV
jgi:hypothetical protein